MACSRLSNSGEDEKVKGTRKVGGAGKRKKAALSLPIFLQLYFFVFVLLQFSRPDYLGAWNRLGQDRIYVMVLKKNFLSWEESEEERPNLQACHG